MGESERSPSDDDEEIAVSVRTGQGLDQVRSKLRDLVFRGLVELDSEAPVVTHERQARALGHAGAEVASFARALDAGVPAEVAATHLRAAESALEEVLGILSPDDVLDHLFRSFCIGK